MKKIFFLLILLLTGSLLQAQALRISLDTVNANPGDSISIPVTTQNFFNIGSMTLYIQYNASILQFSHVANWNDQLLPGIHLSNHSGNTLALVWVDINGANIPDGKIGDLRFKYLGGQSTLSFLATSEITDIWGAPVSPPPVFTNGLVKLKLSATASASPPNICYGDSTQLNVVTAGGLGTSTQVWTSDPPGFYSVLKNPWVHPAVPTTYQVMATDGNDTAYSTIFVDVYDNTPPDPVSNLFPADNSLNLSIPVLISWSPALYATAYDFYLWQEGNPEPLIPAYTNLSSLNININTGLNYGTTYHWRIVSKNPCLSTPGPLMTFSIRFLPDLIIEQVSAPATAYSGQNISATFQVKNTGLGSTQNAGWTDQLFLSSDTTYEGGIDVYLGALPNVSSLNPGESYIQTIAFTLPQGLSGYFYLIAKTDFHNNVNENNNANNSGFNADTFLITLSPTPDLQVTKIIIPNSIFSGQPMSLSWKVENKGTAATPGSSWYDRVYLSMDTVLQPSTAHILGTIHHTGVLGVDSAYTQQSIMTIPNNILGRHFIYVVTDFYNDVYEHALENNNSLKSDSLTIYLTPPPDLEVSSILVTDSASKNEYINVTFTVENVGGNPATGYWLDRIYISNSLNLNTTTATLLDYIYHWTPLNPEASYTHTSIVRIPESIVGTYYIFVFTDVSYLVFEHTFEANNILRSSEIQILAPDLSTVSADWPATTSSGLSVNLPYTIINNGPGKLIDSWVDRVFVSTYSSFHPDSVLDCGQVVMNNRVFNSNQIFDTTAHISIPNGISGLYYFYIVNDYLNSIQEPGAENNNVYRSPDPIQINLSPWPDLMVDQIVYPTDTLNAGLYMDLEYRVLNQGAGNASPPPFSDFIYLSTNPFNPVNLIAVSQVSHTAAIPAGDGDTIVVNLQIPAHLIEGFYYFWINTDHTNAIYEHTAEGNNFSRGNPIYILPYPPVDLVTAVTSAPEAGNSGQPLNISWRVDNQGIAITQNYWWYDAIFLSSDTIYNPSTDILLENIGVSGWLNPGTFYTQNKLVNIPNGVHGNYYLFIVADRFHWVLDPDYSNNAAIWRDPAGDPKLIQISLTPPPDLVLTNLDAPDIIIAGQPFKVKYTIENQGTGNTIPGSWADYVYLSVNFNASGNVYNLVTRSHNGILAPGASYSDSADVFLPANVQGNYILIAQTDYNNHIWEGANETNNLFTKAVSVQQPPPADLTVVNINAATNVIVGNTNNFDVTYKVRNSGLFPATGTMKDLIYLSADTSWDVTDYLAGVIDGYISIGSGLELARSFTGTVNSLAVGDYYVIIRTDVLNNIFESNDTNNTGRTDITTHVDVPELPLNTLVTSILYDYQPIYYRIEVPALLAGEVLYVTLKADSVYGINEMYLRFGSSPTRTEFDFSYPNPAYGNQEIIIPFMQEGTYYLMVYGNTALGDQQNIQLFAKKLDFMILSVTENTGGNSGSMTVKLTGSKFTQNMSVFLVKDNETIEGSITLFIDQSEVYVNFDLTGADTGMYHVVANKFCGGMAMLENGFQIESGQTPNLMVNVYQPSAMGTNGVSTLQIEYTNAGNTDLVAPDCEFMSLKDAPVSLTYQGLTAGLTSLVLQFREPGGPPDILRPGMSGTIIVYIKASKALVFTLKLPNY